MRIRQRTRTTIIVEIDAEERRYGWFDSLAVGLEAAVADLPGGHAVSEHEVEAAQQFSAELTKLVRGG